MDEDILVLLADGEFHSGDELGKLLGISRAGVWKRLQKIEGLGLPLISVKGKGYCIEGGLDLIRAGHVDAELAPAAAKLISNLDIIPVTTSTNQLALAQAEAGNIGYVCTAEQQTQGRGRRGRKWVSPFGASLAVSVVWGFAGGAAVLEGLSLAVGVAVVDALEAVGVSGLSLKWPNDVLYNGRKLAGILVEMVGDPSGSCQVVVGVGINVALPADNKEVIDQPHIDVFSITGRKEGRNTLLAKLLNELMPLLANYEQARFPGYRDRWQALDAFKGKEVFLAIGESAEVGIASGVDDTGALLLGTASGQKKFSGGEVSLRESG